MLVHGLGVVVFFHADVCETPLMVLIACAGSIKDVKWHDVHVGMMLEVRDNENIPADLLCLHCSHADNVCFIKTVNLDGEPHTTWHRRA